MRKLAAALIVVGSLAFLAGTAGGTPVKTTCTVDSVFGPGDLAPGAMLWLCGPVPMMTLVCEVDGKPAVVEFRWNERVGRGCAVRAEFYTFEQMLEGIWSHGMMFKIVDPDEEGI